MSEAVEQVRTINATAIYGRDELAALLDVTKRCIDKRRARRQLPRPDRYVGRNPFWSGKSLARFFGVES